MNATQARKKRSGTTLVQRTREIPDRAQRIDRLVSEASIELMLRQIWNVRMLQQLSWLGA